MREIVEGDVMLTDAYGYTSPSLVRHSFPSHYIDSEANRLSYLYQGESS